MNQIIPFQFDQSNIRAVVIDGEPYFVGKDIAETLGYANHNKALGDHCKGVTKRYPLQTPGGMQEVRIINEPDMLRLIVNSKLPAAEKFERWVFEEVLPSIRKTGSYTAPKPKRQQSPRPATGLTRTQASIGKMIIESAAQHLKLSPSAVLGCYQRLENMAGVSGLVPPYTVDAPDADTGAAVSSEETKSAAELLEIHGVGMSAIAFNKRLVELGFLREAEGPSSNGGMKKFKVCTNMEYGKNLTSPNNQRETQPHWYTVKFAELLALVLPTTIPTQEDLL